METHFFSNGSKVGLRFPIVTYAAILNPHAYNGILEAFYRQNTLGFDYKDISNQKKITILEFNLDDVPEHPFVDTPPENVEKELLKDYLLPLIDITQDRLIKEINTQYSEKQDYGDSAILNLKERYQDKVNELIIMAKEVMHLTPGLKKPMLDSLNQVLDYIEKNVSTNFAEDFSEHKIKFRLNAKEVYHLMVFLNEKNFFNKKLEPSELAKLIEMHFQFHVSGNDYSNFRNAEQQLSNSIHSPRHNGLSTTLSEILKDYRDVMKKAQNQKKKP